MRMVPESPGLSEGTELVEEGISRNDRALSDPCRTVRPLASMLKETMPMLSDIPKIRSRDKEGNGDGTN